MRFEYDAHAHTTYSDGFDAREMAAAAAEAGLSGIGFTDHCIPYEDAFGRHARYDFDETYRERRREIETLREEADAALFDAAEVNYDPTRESTIESFLADADFDYAIGSVHYAGDYDVTTPGDLDDVTAREAVDAYVEWQVRLIESELFDVLAHLDLPQRSPSLRGVMTDEDYRRLAAALAESRTVPELNAGRLDREYGTVHPHPDRLAPFREAGVPFVVGTDSHAPEQVRSRVELVDDLLAELDVELINLASLVA